MGDLGAYGLIALVLGLFGLFIKGKKSDTSGSSESQEVINDFSEKASKAGTDLADNLGAPSAVRKRRVLDWLRTRTADNGEDGNGGG